MAKQSSRKSGNSKKTARTRKAPARPALPTKLIRRILRPDDIALSAAKLFPKEKKAWKQAASNAGYLRIRPTVMLGAVGLCGSLDLGNPPSPEDVEAWEASKPKDHWDYWSLFDFISVPADGPDGGLDVVIFHSQDSFQERPLEVVHRIHLPKAESELFVQERSQYPEFENLTDDQLLEWHWDRLRKALEKQFGAGDLKNQRWTVGGKVYNVTFPDD